MSKELWIEAISKFLLGVLLVGVLLFLPAFSLKYWNAWLFMGLLFIPMFIVGIILIVKNPKLLESRLKAKEKESTQKKVILFSGFMFLLGFVLAGCNYHFNWFQLPVKGIISRYLWKTRRSPCMPCSTHMLYF